MLYSLLEIINDVGCSIELTFTNLEFDNLAPGSHILYFGSEFGCIDSLIFDLDAFDNPQLDLDIIHACWD